MTKALLFLLVVLILNAHSLAISHELSKNQTPSIGKVKNPSGTFAATWFGGFCSQRGKCDSEHLRRWDHQSFTIHGLWPNIKRNQSYDDFDFENVIYNSQLLADLNNYWPPQSRTQRGKRNRDPNKSTYFLWDHEYNKHGMDYSNIIQWKQPKKYEDATDEELQQTYFQAGLRFYSLQNLTKLNLTEYISQQRDDIVNITKSQLAEKIGLDESFFLVNCLDVGPRNDKTQTNILQEIQICFRIDSNLNFTHESCANIKDTDGSQYPMQDNCLLKDDGTFAMLNYDQDNSQEEVTSTGPRLRRDDEDW